MRVDLILKYLFPDAVEGVDYILRDDIDGRGIKIIEWHLADPQPTRVQMWKIENNAILHFEPIDADKVAVKESRRIDEQSVPSIRKFLVDRFGDDSDFPPGLKALDVDADDQKKKMIIK